MVLGCTCLMTSSVEYLNVLSERFANQAGGLAPQLFLYGLRTKNSFYIFKLLKKSKRE